MTVKQKAVAAALLAAALTIGGAFATRVPGVARWLSAFGRNRSKQELNLAPCAKQAFTLISNGNMQSGRDSFAVCPQQELDDPRLKIILSGLDAEKSEFTAIMNGWRPALPSLFATSSESINPQINDVKRREIDAFLKKHPDGYYAGLLTYAAAAAAFNTGDYGGALEVLERHSPGGALRGRAYHLRMFAAVKNGDFKLADRLYKELPSINDFPESAGEVRLLHAYSLHLRGKPGRASADAMAVFASAQSPKVKWHAADLASKIQAESSHPVQAVKTLAAAAASPGILIDADLGALIGERGGPYAASSLSASELAALGSYFIANKRYFDALYLLKTAYPFNPPFEINLLIARACNGAGRPCNPEDTLARLDAAAKRARGVTAGQVCAQRARAILIRNKPGDAKAAESALKGCIANYPARPGEAIELLIGIIDSRDDDALAAKYIEILLKAEPAYSIDLLARLARYRIAQRRLTPAFDAFAAIRKYFPVESYTPAAVYWMGRISLERKDRDAAAAYFTEVVKKYPYSYYWFRAGDRLAEAGISAPAADFGEMPVSDASLIRESYALMDLGYLDDAEIDFNTALARGGVEADAASIGLARIRRLRGDTIRSVKPLEKRIIANQKMYTPVMAHPLYRELLFPTLYMDSVKKRSAENGVTPEATFAVIRQESRFDASATSRSNAKGLMQILPTTGQWIASKRGDASFTVESLYDPDTNITYGTWYLRYLMNRFDGETTLAVAAYNGGPGTVSRLLKSRGYSDRDFFIESIPKFETRDYVKKVLQNYYVYSQLLNAH